MEEQPRDRPPERHYPRHQHPHEDRPSAPDLHGVKHEQLRVQQQETQAKKTGSRRVTVVEQEVEKTSACPAGMSHLPSSHGNRHVINSTLKQPPHSAAPPPSKAAGRAAEPTKHAKDKAELGQAEVKHGVLLVPNGLNCGLLTNGYSSDTRQAADGEAGYTSHKKLKVRSATARNTEHAVRDAERDPPSPEPADKALSSRLEGPRGPPRGQGPGAATADPQRKNCEGRTVAVFGKKPEERHKGSKRSSSPSKEDSWTLFKPPPVFPVDNSSAKIVPKISYASKVKENLNKEAGPPPPAPVRLSQVPMSAMKTISSVSFTNGPLPGNGHPLGGAYLAPGAPQASCVPPGDNVASSPPAAAASPSSAADAFQLKKCTLLIYPLNMHPVLPSARPHQPLAAPADQKALGEIFQNQWGLSFINEPGLGAEGGDTAAEPVTFAPDSKSTCVPPGRPSTAAPLSPAGEDGDEPGFRGPEKSRGELKAPAGGVPTMRAGEGGAKTGTAPLPTLTFGSSKGRGPPEVLDRRSSWGAFDVRAAVTYHTKEIEYIFNLQKQDPRRVVLYQESHDGPLQ